MKTIFTALVGLAVVSWMLWYQRQRPPAIPPGRSEVVFWHFWGGEDRDLVEDVVRQFNQSQAEYHVRAVAMPGNNLQAKLFLAVTGGDPPDLVNQDDPVIPDWADRGVIQSLDSFVPPAEIKTLRQWWLPAANRLSTFDERVFGICNGLDIRALYFNRTMLQNRGLAPPQSIEQLDRIAESIAPPGQTDYQQFGYLPDSRRLQAWAAAFGSRLYDVSTGRLELDSPPTAAALRWMASYQTRYGADQLAGFRKTDQSLPGGTFPLLPLRDDADEGRYAIVMDGQWRVRNIESFRQSRRSRGLTVPEFGVCPLPVPASGSPNRNAGWVNGNFFVVPQGAKNVAGAWAFAKFWIGFQDPEIASATCRRGGWIPVSQTVVKTDSFQKYLQDNPMFETFVELANSPSQFPTPPVVGAGKIKRTLEDVGYQAMHDAQARPQELLRAVQNQFQPHSAAAER